MRLSSALLLALLVVVVSGAHLTRLSTRPRPGHLRPGHRLGHRRPGHGLIHRRPGHRLGHLRPGHGLVHRRPGHGLVHIRPGHGLLHHRPGHVPTSCTYWCKSRTGRFRCCDKRPHHHRPASHHVGRPHPKQTHSGLGPLPVGGGHRGSCPPRRPFCPRHKQQSSAPEVCKGDYSCGHADKCCYDACLELKVCKPAVY